MNIDKNKLRDEVDLRDVMRSGGSLGVNTDARGRFLCPFHHDTKGGNFGVQKSVYHCLACGEGGDVFSYVQKRLGCTFPEALEELAELYGGAERFSDEPIRSAKTGKIRFLSNEELSALGLYHPTATVKDVKVVTEYKEKELVEKYGKPDFMFGDDQTDDGSYIFYSTQRSSLYDLYRENYDSYISLIQGKVKEALENMVINSENLEKNLLIRSIKRKLEQN